MMPPEKEIDRVQVAVLIAMPWRDECEEDKHIEERPGPREASGSGKEKEKEEWAHEHEHAQNQVEEGMRETDAYAIGIAEVLPDGKFDFDIPPRSMDTSRSMDIIPEEPENVTTAR